VKVMLQLLVNIVMGGEGGTRPA